MPLTIERFVTTGFGWKAPAPSSQKGYRNHIKQFEAFLKERNKVAEEGTVTDQDILDYVERLKSKYMPNTIATKIAVVKSYFKWLENQGIITHKPHIRSFPSVKITHKELDASDLNIITANMEGADVFSRRDQAAFALIVYSGFKTEEVVAVNAEDIDFEAAEVAIKKTRYGVSGFCTQTNKCSFRSAISEMKAYAEAKLQRGFCWHGAPPEKEPFFLNKHHRRISGRSLRRRINPHLKEPNSMWDLRCTYLKNLNRIKKAQA